jgi:hypothetical protein
MGLLGTTAPHIENLSFLATFDNIRNNSFHGHLPGKLGVITFENTFVQRQQFHRNGAF